MLEAKQLANGTSLHSFPFSPVQLNPENGRQALYMCAPFPSASAQGGVTIDAGSTLNLDGVMNSLYDREMIPFVGAYGLRLRVAVRGRCKVSLFHRSADGDLVQSGTVKTDEALSARAPAASMWPRQRGLRQVKPVIAAETPLADADVYIDFRLESSEQNVGRWYFTVEALDTDVHLVSAGWEVLSPVLHEVRPAFVICTFKREQQVAHNVDRLLTALKSVVEDYGILIVDNAGTVTAAPSWGPNVQLIPQRNVGGAGGFGRGIFEALHDGRFTHIAMLDDDADIDPLSIVRMVNLFKLSADENLFVGGMQLDVYKPNKLADAGAYWRPDSFERTTGRMAPTDLGSAEAKDAMAKAHRSNFSGWWLFGGHAEGFRRFGFPIPCFVHLDDVEFGVRVYLRGGRTVTVPSIAVWHEPYYAKVEGWFAYYNIRNELVRLSLQAPVMYAATIRPGQKSRVGEAKSRRALVSAERRLRVRFRDFVNSYQYGSAYLLALGIDDFLEGPSLFERDSEQLHKDVMAYFRDFNANYQLLANLPVGLEPKPPVRAGKLYRLFQIYSRNGNRWKKRGAIAKAVTVFRDRDAINWKLITVGQDWGYYDPASAGFHLYRFDPELYALAEKRFNAAIRKFSRNAAIVGAQWAGSYDRIISDEFWTKLVKSFDVAPQDTNAE